MWGAASRDEERRQGHLPASVGRGDDRLESHKLVSLQIQFVQHKLHRHDQLSGVGTCGELAYIHTRCACRKGQAYHRKDESEKTFFVS